MYIEKNIKIEWDETKNQRLIDERNVSFNEVVQKIENDEIIDILTHPKPEYAHQKIMIVQLKDYIHIVPFVIDNQKIFLKTIYPSRQYHAIYSQS